MLIKNDFPIFKHKVDNKELIYFDNAATTQKPQQVIDSIVDFYTKHNANVHRGIYNFGEYATSLFEESRIKVAKFINAHESEVIFTTGTTGSINFVALSWANQHIGDGDEIIVSQMEHHSNLVPWQELVRRKGAILKFIPVLPNGQLDIDAYKNLLNKKTKLVAITHISNVLGTENDINLITQLAHNVGAKILIDAAQSIAYQKVDVKKINCDFLAFSGHKMLGPTGIGVLFIKSQLHEQIDPYLFGGGMIYEAGFEKSSWLKAPYKFESGTPPIAQAISLGAAIDYINQNINFDELTKLNATLCAKVINEFKKIPQIKILGPVDQLAQKGHLISFVIENMHPHDVAAYLDSHGICVRAGHHCAQPLHKALRIDSSIRVSFYAYNSESEVDYFIELIKKLF